MIKPTHSRLPALHRVAIGLALFVAARVGGAQAAPSAEVTPIAVVPDPSSAPPPPPTTNELPVIAIHARTTVAIHFLAHRPDDRYEVHVGERTCATPCTLRLAPGPATIRATGSGRIAMQLVLPRRTAQIRLSHPPAVWLVPTGATLVASGVVVGATFWLFAAACGSRNGCVAANVIFWPLLGTSMIIAGIVFIVRGKAHVPETANRVELLQARAEPRVRLTGFGLAPIGGGVIGGAGFTF